ncbi:hypothetical protein BJ508DRAFT_416259 [Ascobolus immersus RN42]|uniref:MYND-type zinc finger protein samB n=1 Tax=Ascobolus immersus RN42 TaxID=1160509 RepID=A0A3N4I3Z6_ASCIM|nr:hypothetical protein BJ508DRAFT_416259 [Ascobolus immersus RN42]
MRPKRMMVCHSCGEVKKVEECGWCSNDVNCAEHGCQSWKNESCKRTHSSPTTTTSDQTFPTIPSNSMLPTKTTIYNRPANLYSRIVMHASIPRNNLPASAIIYHGLVGSPLDPTSELFRLFLAVPTSHITTLKSPTSTDDEVSTITSSYVTATSLVITGDKSRPCANCAKEGANQYLTLPSFHADFTETEEIAKALGAPKTGCLLHSVWTWVMPTCGEDECTKALDEMLDGIFEGDRADEWHRTMLRMWHTGCFEFFTRRQEEYKKQKAGKTV